MRLTRLGVVASILLSSGCMATLPSQPEAAIVAKVNANQKSQFEQAASQLLFGRSVRIANDAFTQDNKILIERADFVDERGLLLDGRKTDNSAIALTLWLNNGECYLQRDDNGNRVLLADMQCQALANL
jgi:hypothetical protein